MLLITAHVSYWKVKTILARTTLKEGKTNLLKHFFKSFCSQGQGGSALRPGFLLYVQFFGRMTGFEPEMPRLQPGVLPNLQDVIWPSFSLHKTCLLKQKLMALFVNVIFTWKSKYFSKTAAKQFRLRRPHFFTTSSQFSGTADRSTCSVTSNPGHQQPGDKTTAVKKFNWKFLCPHNQCWR